MKKGERRKPTNLSLLPSVVKKGRRLTTRLNKRSLSHTIEDVLNEKYDANLMEQRVNADKG